MVNIIAHRGYKKRFPENSLIAFQQAVYYGADGVELDVHLSKDHEIIVIHDADLKRTTTKKGRIKDLSLSEIKKARIKGCRRERVPTLKEVLNIFHGTKLIVNIEIKSTEPLLQDKIIELIEAMNMTDQIIISSFYMDVIQRIKTISKVETAMLYTKYMDQPWLLQSSLHFDGIHADTFYISKGYVEKIMAQNQCVRIYTVNREVDLLYWLDSIIDAVITDDVELAVKLKKFIDEN